MSFEDVAKEVIKNSIRSAVCIDDEYPSAYQEKDGLKKEEAANLYTSFRDVGNCDLDIYNFESLEKSWKIEYMIPNKDLIILDWELSKSTVEDKFKDTLTILSDIIESQQIPFVVIYTFTEDIKQISKTLIEEFSLKTVTFAETIAAIQEGVNSCDPMLDYDTESVMESKELLKLYYQYIHDFSERGETKDEILNYIKVELHLNATLKLIDRKLKKALSALFVADKDYLVLSKKEWVISLFSQISILIIYISKINITS